MKTRTSSEKIELWSQKSKILKEFPLEYEGKLKISKAFRGLLKK